LSAGSCAAAQCWQPYHLGRLCSSDREFEVCIFLPVSEQKWKFGEKAIIGVSSGCDRLGAGIAIQASFEGLCGTNKLLPIFEIVGVLSLTIR
jgi:hypothetical protein